MIFSKPMLKKICLLFTAGTLLLTAGCSGNGKNTESGVSQSGNSSEIPSPETNFPESSKVSKVSFVEWLTSDRSPSKTKTNWDVGGTDLGIPCYDEKSNKMYFAFGDTYSDATQSGNWRSNVIGVTTDFDASDSITFDSFLNNNRPIAKELFVGNKLDNEEVTKIPTGAICIDGNLYMFYMSVRHWGVPSDWTINYNTVMKTTDGGETWTQVPDLLWAGYIDPVAQKLTGKSAAQLNAALAPNFLQNFPIDGKDGYIYIYGIGGGRFGGVKLARVAKANFEKFSEYEYFNGLDDKGDPIFIKGIAGLLAVRDSESSYILPPRAGEMSVMYNEYLGKWMTIYQMGNNLIYRTSDKPWGTWSDPETLVTYTDYNGLYCGFMHEKYTEEKGKVVYFFMSQWDYYNVRVMKLEFK